MKNFKLKLLSIIPIVLVLIMVSLYFVDRNITKENSKSVEVTENEEIKTARVIANGDLLYHDILYWSAEKEDGSYDFNPYFMYVKDRISEADLAIGDYEGTISDKHYLGGYPLFNAPKETASSMKDVGYDVVDLAHNHILDSGLYGLINTYNTFKNLGLSPVGVYVEKTRNNSDILIKEVNGIKIAILAYSYGFNGLESSLTQDEYNNYLSDLNEEKMKKEIEKAEQLADVTIVLPQMGVEYALSPNEEQRQLYNKMLDWGADVVFGNHPHVVQPAEVVEKNGDKKLIIYSMGNFISNQTYEMLNNKWTERGVLMDVTFEKNGDKTIIKNAKAHPTYVVATKNGKTTKNGYDAYDYRVVVAEDFLKDGKYYGTYSGNIQQKIEATYNEMNEHVGLKWDN